MKHVKCYIKNYPRPQFVRSDWENLNGQWRFAFGEEVEFDKALDGELNRTIIVPYSYETEMSTINEQTPHDTVWYSRIIKRRDHHKNVLLHFEGADYDTTVYINGCLVGSHRGAYSRFTFDITKYLTKTDNVLTVRCEDTNHPGQVRGKQRWEDKNFGCWYTQTTGIYKTVWLEYVEDTHLGFVKITPSVRDYTVRFDFSLNAPAADCEIKYHISLGDKSIHSGSIGAFERDNTISVRLDSTKLTYQVELWSENNPVLYDVKFEVYKGGVLVDEVGSYFGLRDFVAKDKMLLLNNLPSYLRLVLDQGYWRESGLTPPSEEAIEKDIQLCKSMGFNGVRKHQKVEDELFMYYADVMGFYVWCELPSNHWFSDCTSEQITREWLQVVRQNYNHPSIITWVVFNESWGVRNIFNNDAQSNLAMGLYYLTKSIDTMRPVISNDGWMHAKSDVLTLHHYEQDGDKLYDYYDSLKKLTEGSTSANQLLPYALNYQYEGQPIVFSEFGGTAYVSDTDKGWGYGNSVKDEKEFIERYTGLIEAIEKMDISGYCYTQLTDVQQEVNGLLTEDRQPKIPLEMIRDVNLGKI